MAIKGKGRTRGRRTISAPPRPQLVVRKPPLWRRRWVWATLGAIVLVGIGVGVLLALRAHDRTARKRDEHAAVLDFVNKLNGTFPADRTPVPPDAIFIFTSVAQDVGKIGTTLNGPKLVTRGEQVARQAARSADELRALKLSRAIPAKFAQDRTSLAEAQYLITRAYSMYQQIGKLMAASASLKGAEQKAVVTQINGLISQAGSLFDHGYRQVVAVAKRVNVSTNIPFNPAPNSPGPPTAAPTGASPSPGGTPSATAPASPTPSSSG